MFNEHLNWLEHITSLVNKCTRFCSIFGKQRALIPLTGRKLLYHAFINSIISYCIIIYGNSCLSHLKSLHLACNRVLRILQFASRDTNTSALYTNFKILPVHLLYKFELGKFLFKVFNCSDLVPEVIVNIFCNSVYTHNLNTRAASSTILYCINSSADFRSYRYVAFDLWNHIPVAIRNSPNLFRFNLLYKNFLTNHQS